MESMFWQISIIEGDSRHGLSLGRGSLILIQRAFRADESSGRASPSFTPLQGAQSNRRYIIELNIAWSKLVWDHLTCKRDRLFFQDKRGDTLFKNDLLRQERFNHKRKDDVGEHCLALEFLMIFNEILLSIISETRSSSNKKISGILIQEVS